MTAPELSNGVIHRQNITYCERAGIKLQGGLYLPRGDGPFPILIGVPGDGWTICMRTTLRHWGFYLASRGYSMLVIDYRLATSTRKAFPEAVQDVITAIRFIRNSQSELSIESGRIGLLGASAGAHLAALAALGGGAAFGAHPGDALAVQSEVFVRTLQQARFTVRTHKIAAASHFRFSDPVDDPSSDSANLAPRLMRFIKRAL